MNQSYQFIKTTIISVSLIVSFFCLLTSAVAQDYWVAPTGGGFGAGTSGASVGSGIQADQQVGTIGNRVVLFFGIDLPPGATRGEPDILVPMLDLNGNPVVVPISQVTRTLEEGGSAPTGLVIMNDPATGKTFAVKKEKIAEYTSKGCVLGPIGDTKEGIVMCLNGEVVVVPSAGLESFKTKNPTATSGKCK
jgi:hypothetical protein